MPIYPHAATMAGFAAVNAALGKEFAQNGGITGMFSKDPNKEAQLRAINAEITLQKMRGEQSIGDVKEHGAQDRLTVEQGAQLGLSRAEVDTINTTRIDAAKSKNTISEKQAQGEIDRLTAEQGAKLGLSRAEVDTVNTMRIDAAKSGNTIKERRAQGEIDSGLHKTATDSAIQVNRDSQAGGVMSKLGILQDPQTTNEKVQSASITDPTLRVRHGELADAEQTQELERGVKATPQGMNAQIAKFLAGQYAPAIANYKLGTIEAGPGSVSMPPSGNGIELPAPDRANAVRGALSSQEVQQGGIDPLTGVMRPDKITAGQRFPIDMSGLPEPMFQGITPPAPAPNPIQATPPPIPAPMGIPQPKPQAVLPGVNPTPTIAPEPPQVMAAPAAMPPQVPQYDSELMKAQMLQRMANVRDKAGAAFMGDRNPPAGAPLPTSVPRVQAAPTNNRYALSKLSQTGQLSMEGLMKLIAQIKSAQIPDPFKNLQIPDPFAR